MSEVSTKRWKREANREDYERLLARFHPEPDRAWTMLDELRRKLVVFFEYQFPCDAETLADEALDRIAQKADSYPIVNVAEFAFGIARNLRRENMRRAEIVARTSSATRARHADSSDLAIARIDLQGNLKRLVECLQGLAPEERTLLLRYYPQQNDGIEQRRQTLAEELGITTGALRTRMARLRTKVERLFWKDTVKPERRLE